MADSSTTDLQSAALELGAVRSNNNSTLRPPPTVDGVVLMDSHQPNGGRFSIAEAEENGNGEVGPDTDRSNPPSGTGVRATAGSPKDDTRSSEGGEQRHIGKTTLPIIVQPMYDGPKSELANANHYPSQRESSQQKHPIDNGATPIGSLHMEAEVSPSKTTGQTAEVRSFDAELGRSQ